MSCKSAYGHDKAEKRADGRLFPILNKGGFDIAVNRCVVEIAPECALFGVRHWRPNSGVRQNTGHTK
jgi:hypothetical protein